MFEAAAEAIEPPHDDDIIDPATADIFDQAVEGRSPVPCPGDRVGAVKWSPVGVRTRADAPGRRGSSLTSNRCRLTSDRRIASVMMRSSSVATPSSSQD